MVTSDQSEASNLIIDQSQVSMDNESSENWWDTVDMTKLILACNKISSISPKVTLDYSLQSFYVYLDKTISLPPTIRFRLILGMLSANV